jgi:hypothetical protein
MNQIFDLGFLILDLLKLKNTFFNPAIIWTLIRQAAIKIQKSKT